VNRIRTVLGDIDASDLGPTYAHEHLVIDGGRPVELEPDFLLADVDKAIGELMPARALGLAAVVDAMPCSAGRNVRKLVAISRATGIHVVAPTGLHLAKYYSSHLWSEQEPADQLAERFRSDIEHGIDVHDYAGTDVERTTHRAGVIKVAGSDPALTARERRVFEAAAIAHVRTGCPILAHTTNGVGAIEQLAVLAGFGVSPGHVVLSHTDKVVDRSYHRDILAAGAYVAFDQGFRWRPDVENGTLTLLDWLIDDGFGNQLMLAMDAARRGYWTTYGGRPGMTFLLGSFSDAMRARGISDQALRAIFVDNPARAFAFAVMSQVDQRW
jgi:5-phospho-D-xylono-1,4-lactonase